MHIYIPYAYTYMYICVRVFNTDKNIHILTYLYVDTLREAPFILG